VTVVLLVEGETETVLKDHLKHFLDVRADLEGRPKVALRTKDIMALNEGKLRGRIRLELNVSDVTALVGLVDVYPRFADAAEAKAFLLRAANGDPRFYAHAAQYEVEAWLLPYWETICERVGVRHAKPGPDPEKVDLDRPPSRRLEELYRLAKPSRRYIKTIEMATILRDKDLVVAAGQCPELMALLNTLLRLGGLSPL